MIPDEICLKYLGAVQADYGDDMENFYDCFLRGTDHIPNKIIESLVLTLHEAQPLTLVASFISWLKNSYGEYANIISYRETARTELAKIREENQ